MVPKKTSKRHHHTAQYYLMGWADEDERIWVHRRGWEAPKRLHVRETAFENHMYRLENPSPGIPADALEQILADVVDGPASEILPKLLDGENLSVDERLIFARHLAVQLFRGPSGRSMVKQTTEYMMTDITKEMLKKPKKFLEVTQDASDSSTLTEEQLAQVAQWLNSGQVRVEMSLDQWRVNIFQQLFDGEVSATIASLPWKLVTSHLGRFITSDTPFIMSRVLERATNGRRRGMLSDAVETTFVLDPQHVLLMRPGIDQQPGVAKVKWRRDLNRRTLEHASAEFYASEAQPDLLARFNGMRALEIETATYAMPDNSSIMHSWTPEVSGIPFD